MYQGKSEKRDVCTTMFFYEGDLLFRIDQISEPGEMWDVYRDGRLAYYYTPYK